MDVLGEKVARCEVAQESDLGICAEPGPDEVGDFGDDQRRNDEGSWVGLE